MSHDFHPISDHQADALRRRDGATPNGIMCSTCFAGLHDRAPGFAMLSDPPALEVFCPVCGFKGLRWNLTREEVCQAREAAKDAA